MQEVTATEFCFSTPRIIMQKCMASMTTPTPWGWSFSSMHLGDLHGEPLLHLQPPREHVDEARDLREAHHLALGNVGHVGLAEEGQEVVLAEAEDVDVADDHHLVVLDGEERLVEELVGVLRGSPG